MMFGSLSLLVFGLTLLAMATLWVVDAAGPAPLPRWRLTRGRRWIIWLAMVATLCEAATAMIPHWWRGELRGWWLLVHMAFAPLFILGLVLLSAALPATNGIAAEDSRVSETRDSMGLTRPAAQVLFWIVVLGGVVTAGSMLWSMTSWPDQALLHDLLAVHRYSGLVMTAAMILYGYLSVIRQ